MESSFWTKSLHNRLRLRFKGNEYGIYYIPASSKIYLISKDMLLRQLLPPYDYDIEDCKAILLYEAEKPFTSLAKRMVDEVIDEHASKTSASLPLLPSDDM